MLLCWMVYTTRSSGTSLHKLPLGPLDKRCSKFKTRKSRWPPSLPYLIVISLLNKKCFSVISQFHVQIHGFPVDFYVNLKEKQTSLKQETSWGRPCLYTGIL